MRVFVWLIAVAVVLSACSADADEPDRLAIVDAGNVVVLDADGSNRIEITAQPQETFFQPVWSPDGELLAFSQVSSTTSLHVAAADGSLSRSVAVETLPFYFSWSANNSLALLRNGVEGIELEQTRFADDELIPLESIATGAPLYFSWSPNDGSMVTHIGTDRLEVTDGSGSSDAGPAPGRFQAPRWSERGIFAVERGARSQQLVVLRSDNEVTPLATLDGQATFVVSDDAVAMQVVAEDVNGLSAALQTVPTVRPNRVEVLDLDTGLLTAATTTPALAFFWSPSGEHLLILDIVSGPQARWSLWNEDGLVEIVRFEPDGGFMRNLVPFFDQYAQSLSLWAPDGSAFAFPGTVDGEAGIWIYDTAGNGERISSGTWVSWAP